MSKNQSRAKPETAATEAMKKSQSERLAQLAIDGLTGGIALVQHFNKLDDSGAVDLLNALESQMSAVTSNDLNNCERILFGQAHALNAIFVRLAFKANSQEYLKHCDAFFRIALKAQNQCRMTLETLANIKNPPVIYAKQANISHGHQQVNNGQASTSTPTQAEKNISQPNELLEQQPHEQEWLDTRAPGATGTTDSTVAAVAEIDRRKKPGRKTTLKS